MDDNKKNLSDTLLIAKSEILFGSETKTIHISNTFNTQKDRENAINKKQVVKPEIGIELKIKIKP